MKRPGGAQDAGNTSEIRRRAPEGTVLWRALLGGARDPEALAATDAELVARTLETQAQLLVTLPALGSRLSANGPRAESREPGATTRPS